MRIKKFRLQIQTHLSHSIHIRLMSNLVYDLETYYNLMTCNQNECISPHYDTKCTLSLTHTHGHTVTIISIRQWSYEQQTVDEIFITPMNAHHYIAHCLTAADHRHSTSSQPVVAASTDDRIHENDTTLTVSSTLSSHTQYDNRRTRVRVNVFHHSTSSSSSWFSSSE